MSRARRLVVLLAAACSGKAKPADDASSAQRAEAKPTEAHEPRADPAGASGAPAAPSSGKGDVQIRVEWKDVPAAARTPPGRNACGDRAASVAPTTTWGVPDVFVEISGAPVAAAPRANRIVVDRCTPSPRAIAGSGVTIASTAPLPLRLQLARIGKLPLGSAAAASAPHDVYLPIAGHEVAPALDADGFYTVTLGDEQTTIVASDSTLLGITEASGQVILRDVPSGNHAIVAWLPARSGQPARVGKGKVNVAAGALTEVTVDITAP